ncbi:MAG: hypothetical protein AAF265_13645 [Pseudomonadota bacterium]
MLIRGETPAAALRLLGKFFTGMRTSQTDFAGTYRPASALELQAQRLLQAMPE